MRKFIKYEVKGTYRFVLGILAALLVAFTIIQVNISRQIKVEFTSGVSTTIPTFNALLVGLAAFVIFGAYLTAFIYIINSFRKELYEDRGYLTFTLPLSGNKIVGGKLIVALLWYTVLGLGILLYNALLAIILYGSTDWFDAIKYILNQFSGLSNGVVSIGIISIVSIIVTLITMYFSIAISRVSVKNKKMGGLWFLIFLILNGILSYLTLKISGWFPYYLNVNNFKIFHRYSIIAMPGITEGIGQMMLFGTNYNAYVNIIGNLAQILIGVLIFTGTGYLIEKKIDL